MRAVSILLTTLGILSILVLSRESAREESLTPERSELIRGAGPVDACFGNGPPKACAMIVPSRPNGCEALACTDNGSGAVCPIPHALYSNNDYPTVLTQLHMGFCNATFTGYYCRLGSYCDGCALNASEILVCQSSGDASGDLVYSAQATGAVCVNKCP